MKRRASRLVPVVMVVLACGETQALVTGRTAEDTATQHERRGEHRQAALWRLVAARTYSDLIIPWEIESARAYRQTGNDRLAKICADRAERLYPTKVRENLERYEEDLKKAGGEPLRTKVEREATEQIAKWAPIPTEVPSRLSHVEEIERKKDWPLAADYRELAGRVYLNITVPFFEREAARARDDAERRRWRTQALEHLKDAQENFLDAAENYRLALKTVAAKTDADSRRLANFYREKAVEMDAQAKVVADRVVAGERNP